jgi:hypothetical protein
MRHQQMSRAPIQVALRALVVASAALVLSACGHSVASPAQSATSPEAQSPTTSSAAQSPTTPPTTTPLTCTLSEHGSGVDIISATLSCSVSGAVASETSFALTYTAPGPNGQAHPTSSQCSGALQHGSGTCSQTYSFVAPSGGRPGTVAGETLPDHHQLGPVTPQMVS